MQPFPLHAAYRCNNTLETTPITLLAYDAADIVMASTSAAASNMLLCGGKEALDERADRERLHLFNT